MNKFVFLRAGLPAIWLTIVLCLIYSYFDEKSTWWFMILECLFFLFVIIFINDKTLGKLERSKEFTNRVKLTYTGSLNELISDFYTCDLFFHQQIGDCYTFSSKRSMWINQMFFVEKIEGVLHIVCNQYSLKQLKQHPVSFTITTKICEDRTDNNNSNECSRIIFDKIK
jgi:hypothetical protein